MDSKDKAELQIKIANEEYGKPDFIDKHDVCLLLKAAILIGGMVLLAILVFVGGNCIL